MSPFAILLRVLLSISLVLNGMGTAVAATRMLVDHAATSVARTVVATTEVVATLPCEQHHGMAAAVSEGPAPIAAADTGAVKTKHPTPDCCKSGKCGCACLQATPAALLVMSLPQAVIARGAGVRAMKPEHASPALPQLIRPPIG